MIRIGRRQDSKRQFAVARPSPSAKNADHRNHQEPWADTMQGAFPREKATRLRQTTELPRLNRGPSCDGPSKTT